jgi:hypothetical protein
VSAPRTIAAIAGRDAGLQFVDLRDPAAPASLASFATQGPALGITLATTPSVQGAAAIAYVAEGVSGVEIVALGAKDQPRRLAALPASSAAAALVLDGSTLYVAGGWEGVLAYDVSDPANPRLLGTHAVEGYAYDVQVAGDLLLVAAGTGGVLALPLADLRGPAHRLMLPFLSAAPPR